jgi:hypothetical protein
MGSVVSRNGIAVLDDWDGSVQFATGVFDKIDVTAFNGDVLAQVLTPNGDWQPTEGILTRRGLFKSTPGFSAIYPPGPTQVRFKRAVAGVGATVDFTIYAPDQGSL